MDNHERILKPETKLRLLEENYEVSKKIYMNAKSTELWDHARDLLKDIARYMDSMGLKIPVGSATDPERWCDNFMDAIEEMRDAYVDLLKEL